MEATKKYLQFITELKQNIIQSRYLASKLINREQLLLYFKTGEMISKKVVSEKWGNNVLEKIAEDLQTQLPGLRGFSSRNLRKMRQFFQAYASTDIGKLLSGKTTPRKSDESQINSIWPSATAKLDAFFGISFTHHILILNKCRKEEEKLFYINNAATELWSVSVLEHHIDSNLFEKLGNLPNNFSRTLPDHIKPSALQIFKDEYLLDFMTVEDCESEKEIENKVVTDIRNFILRMGKGFSFIENQFRVELDGEEFFIDLLFFNRYLQCLVAFELKKGRFRPEYAGQLNFYLNVLDEKIKLPHENTSIGIVLCKEKNNTIVEFSVKCIDKAMGVATFKTSKEVPKEMQGFLPDVDQLGQLIV